MGPDRWPRVPLRLDRARRRWRRSVFHADLGARPRGREGDARGVRRPGHGPPRPRPRDARLPLRRLRVGRAQAADAAARDARGRGRCPASRARPREPLRPRRPPGHPGERRELLDQEARDVLHARAGGRHHAGRVQRRRVRALDGDRRPGDPRGHRGLQPRRLRLEPAAARLAGGPPARGARPRSPTGSSPGRSRPTGPRRRTSRPRRRRREPGRTTLRAELPVDRLARDDEPAGAAGCSPRSSTGTAARRSRSGGITSAWPRRRSRSWSRDAVRAGRPHVRRGPRARARSRASTAIGSTRRRTPRSSRASP